MAPARLREKQDTMLLHYIGKYGGDVIDAYNSCTFCESVFVCKPMLCRSRCVAWDAWACDIQREGPLPGWCALCVGSCSGGPAGRGECGEGEGEGRRMQRGMEVVSPVRQAI